MASPEIHNLAQRLLILEAAHSNTSNAEIAVRVIEQLRMRLIKLAGVDGFRALLSRALALAKMEFPSLNGVHVGEDGTLRGFDAAEQSQHGAVLVAHLLELLVTFIGESLTLHMVRDAWPDASIERAEEKTEDTP